MSVPKWVRDVVFYQIFPDRFMNGDLDNDPPVVLRWDKAATLKGFHGGDLAGIAQRLDYLQDLGVNALYLNPIFQSPSNHRYNTLDYYKIDPKLGDMRDFSNLIKEVHSRGMRIILDGVFNHTARGFFAFDDILENGPDSPYLYWYSVKQFPLDAYSAGDAKNYLAWWNFKSLPKLNTANPQVRKYIMDVARYWIDQGIDGWRLDVPNEIDDDSFWDEFRHVVRRANPDAYLVGEIWDTQPRWVNDTHFDGLMHYPIRAGLLNLLNGVWDVAQFGKAIQEQLDAYPWENQMAMYVLLGSHDTERILTALHGNEQKVRLAALFQFAYPGAPAIYYGDEIGLQGGKDPACRGGFPWDRGFWNTELRGWYQKLAVTRRATSALRSGSYQVIKPLDEQPVYAFARILEKESVLVLMNAGDKPVSARVNAAEAGWSSVATLRSLLDNTNVDVKDGVLEINLPAWGGFWLEIKR